MFSRKRRSTPKGSFPRYKRIEYTANRYDFRDVLGKMASCGYPKLGNLICQKGRVMVLAYGAHKVVRICLKNWYTTPDKPDYATIADVNIAKSLINNPIPRCVRVYKAELIAGASVITMRKYSGIGARRSYESLSELTDDDMNTTIPAPGEPGFYREHELNWDVHNWNVGTYPKDPTRKLVLFDVWSSIG